MKRRDFLKGITGAIALPFVAKVNALPVEPEIFVPEKPFDPAKYNFTSAVTEHPPTDPNIRLLISKNGKQYRMVEGVKGIELEQEQDYNIQRALGREKEFVFPSRKFGTIIFTRYPYDKAASKLFECADVFYIRIEMNGEAHECRAVMTEVQLSATYGNIEETVHMRTLGEIKIIEL